MDELEKRAATVGGWEALARLLDTELRRIKGKRGRPQKELNDLDIIAQLPFPHYGGPKSDAAYIKIHLKLLRELFGADLKPRSLMNELSRLRKRNPPPNEEEWQAIRQRRKMLTPEQIEEMFRNWEAD